VGVYRDRRSLRMPSSERRGCQKKHTLLPHCPEPRSQSRLTAYPRGPLIELPVYIINSNIVNLTVESRYLTKTVDIPRAGYPSFITTQAGSGGAVKSCELQPGKIGASVHELSSGTNEAGQRV